jgi:hypothetical protein
LGELIASLPELGTLDRQQLTILNALLRDRAHWDEPHGKTA